MHEFPMCQQILKIIEEFKADTPFERILKMEAGELVAVEKSALLGGLCIMD